MFRFLLAFYARKAGNILGTLLVKDDQTCGVALSNKLTCVIASTPATFNLICRLIRISKCHVQYTIYMLYMLLTSLTKA